MMTFYGVKLQMERQIIVFLGTVRVRFRVKH